MDCASPHAAPHAAAHATLLAAPPPDPNPNPNPNRTARHTGLPKTPGSSHCPYPYPNPIAARASLDGRLKSLPSRLIAACHTQHQRECTVFPRRRPAPRRPAANRLATRHTPHNTQHTTHAARRTPHAARHTTHAARHACRSTPADYHPIAHAGVLVPFPRPLSAGDPAGDSGDAAGDSVAFQLANLVAEMHAAALDALGAGYRYARKQVRRVRRK